MDPSLLNSIRRHLEGLKRTPDGLVLYKLIERGLKKFGGNHGEIEQAFGSFLHSLLDRYARDAHNDPMTRIKARVIQQRLALHLPPQAATSLNRTPPETKIVDTASEPGEVGSTATAATGDEAPISEDLAIEISPPVEAIPAASETLSSAHLEEIPATASAEEKPALEELQETLAEGVTQSIAAVGDRGESVAIGDTAMSQINDKIGAFNELKHLLVKGLDELIKEHQELKHKLNSAGEYMKAVEADRNHLRGELAKARKHGMADDLTGLPKREVFIRQLEAEVGRVKRYGFALALALIDLDGLEVINDRYGREVGDAVLRCYASEVLAKFRSYDLVARYGGDEFAVLFPNTQKEGAIKALEKARKGVVGTFVTHDGHTIPLPSFSSVLTLYSPGEPPAVLLKRADQALDHVKQRGPDRIVVALPTA